MFQDMNKMLDQSMGPFKELVDIQTKMLEELTRQQMDCTKACIEATVQQTKELQKCKSPADLLELQKAYAKELEDTLRSANQQNLTALTEAREAMQKLTEGAFDRFNAGK
ncbi:MAG: flavodoxin [Oceanospirillaceae bacterium]|uniref:phasin family protein n=1 Tax=Marinobacterium litorale TaxID=404770 RepID=UPI0004192C5C|nr:phasin family protein [Marinobacterium litorale]MBS98921.1 flavodoxin [Oceanospirillaceae bacterium]